jgi:succinate dehydrogenase hydrophobic anchor subunit
VVIEDYSKPGFWQGALRFVIFLLWLFFGLVGIYIVLGL